MNSTKVRAPLSAAFFLAVIMAFQSTCCGDVTKLSADDVKVLRDISRFHEIHTATNLPPEVFALCADGNNRLAEPGQKWEVTDLITDPTLPRKRLIWAVTDDVYFVVHYESGGIGHGYHVVIAKRKTGGGRANLLWHGVGDPLKDYRAFLDAIVSNKLDDSLDYAR